MVSGQLTLFDGQLRISYVALLTIVACIVIMLALTAFTSRSKLGKAMAAVYQHIRKSVPAWEHDQISYIEMNKFDKMVKSAELNDLVEQTIGKLN